LNLAVPFLLGYAFPLAVSAEDHLKLVSAISFCEKFVDDVWDVATIERALLNISQTLQGCYVLGFCLIPCVVVTLERGLTGR
jgi:hypothetical protein